MTPNMNILTVLESFNIKLAESESLIPALFSRLQNVGVSQGNNLENDSRKVKAGDVFCATIGHHQDGRDYIASALNQGASVVLAQCEQLAQHGDIRLEQNAVVIEFYQLDKHLFALAKTYYQAPQKQLNIIGITGTNGKTTISQLIAQLIELTNNQKQCAVIGTTGAGKVGQLTPVVNTTPGAIELHQLFYRFSQQGITDVAMEVSSHALVQQRVKADLFSSAIFSNLSHDHLDYHNTMDEYAEAKFTIFSGNNSQVAIVNGDDNYGREWLKTDNSAQTKVVYGREAHEQNFSHFVVAKNIKHTSEGLNFTVLTHLGEIKAVSPLLGDFNLDNLLAAIAVLLTQGIALEVIEQAIPQVAAVAGRMEKFTSANSKNKNLPTAIVDYAHTPDALENALKACLQHSSNELWLVFGCGGDRDVEKRAPMGAIAAQYADHIIITNDNPRSESPEHIAEQIIANNPSEKFKVVLDREQAVKYALTSAKSSDLVLLAGKGHEQHIVIADQVIPYNERRFVQEIYQKEACA